LRVEKVSKLEFIVSDKIGLRKKDDFKQIVDVDKCVICEEKINDILKDDKKSSLSDLDSDESDSDSDSGSESDDEESVKESDMKSADKIKTINLINLDKNEVEMEELQVDKIEMEEPKINVDEEDLEKDLDKDAEKDYSKMSIKQLKEILSGKGIVPTKMKKNEMIELIEKSSVTIDENE
jgi:hypothetical protein